MKVDSEVHGWCFAFLACVEQIAWDVRSSFLISVCANVLEPVLSEATEDRVPRVAGCDLVVRPGVGLQI